MGGEKITKKSHKNKKNINYKGLGGHTPSGIYLIISSKPASKVPNNKIDFILLYIDKPGKNIIEVQPG